MSGQDSLVLVDDSQQSQQAEFSEDEPTVEPAAKKVRAGDDFSDGAAAAAATATATATSSPEVAGPASATATATSPEVAGPATATATGTASPEVTGPVTPQGILNPGPAPQLPGLFTNMADVPETPLQLFSALASPAARHVRYVQCPRVDFRSTPLMIEVATTIRFVGGGGTPLMPGGTPLMPPPSPDVQLEPAGTSGSVPAAPALPQSTMRRP